MALTKQPAFTKKTTDLPDVPSPTYTPTQIKEYIQNPSDELMTNFNNAIDKLNATTDGNSGADNIGATGFDGTPSNPQAMLEDLNTRKADKGTDWTGTWQGYTPSKADPGISSVVDQHTSQLADNSSKIADNKKQYVFNKFNMKYKNDHEQVYGYLKRISVIGDSISHGAGSQFAPDNSWAGLVRKFMTSELGGNLNYGFVNFSLPLTASNATPDEDAIEVTKVGTWTEQFVNGTYVGGYSIYSVTLGDSLSIKVKQSSKYIRIYYGMDQNSGSFDVKINGELITTISTATPVGTTPLSYNGVPTALIDTSRYPANYTLELVKKDTNKTTFSGMEFIDDSDTNLPVFENYSKSGIALVDYDDTILNGVLDSNIVFFALGYNDKFGRQDITGFTNKMTTAINTLKTKNVFVVVCDFLWNTTIDDAYRQQLVRLHSELENSIYIPFPDMTIFMDTTSGINGGFLVDGAHPTPLGHQMIAEFIAKELNLSVTSKTDLETTKITKIENVALDTIHKRLDGVDGVTINIPLTTKVAFNPGEYISMSMNASVNETLAAPSDYGLKVEITFSDGTIAHTGITRNTKLDQDKDTNQKWNSGNYAGFVSKVFQIPTNHGTVSSIAVTLFNSGAHIYAEKVMICKNSEGVNWLPAYEDFTNWANLTSQVDTAPIPNNSLFVDGTNVLKFKDNTGTIKTVTLA